MSLDPSPLSPRPTPLLNPTDPAPGRGSALIGGGVAVVLAAIIAFVSLTEGTHLLYLPQGLQAHANAVVNQLPQIQGFSDYWTKSFDVNGFKGYTDANADTNQKIMNDEATTYHMNLAVITITADMQKNTDTSVNFDPISSQNTYSDAVYSAMANQARANGMTPAFRLEVRITNDQNHNYASTPVGQTWGNAFSVPNEQAWFNSYTNFAVHYALLAQKLNVPLLIIGSDLAYITTDANPSSKKLPGRQWGNPDDGCYGPRDCEWRHVIRAVHSSSYTPIGSKKATKGGGYVGALTFAATAKIDPTGNSALQTGSQWTLITFWDALNVIGIDAFVPLTNGGADPTPSELESAWKGEYIPGATPTNAVGNIFKKMRDMSDHYNRRILFTGAGYESLTGATAAPGSYPGTQIDPAEQQNDMEGLLQTFSNEPWWLGVIWSYDYPVWPRNSLADTSSSTGYPGLAEANYDTNTEWAGKQAGKYLGQTYQNAPLPETLWEALTQQ